VRFLGGLLAVVFAFFLLGGLMMTVLFLALANR
jgi:hypothetical protein